MESGGSGHRRGPPDGDVSGAVEEFLCVEQNLLALFRHLAGGRESGEILELPGVSIASSNVDFHMFNVAFLSGSAANLESSLAAATLHFGARERRWAFWLCDGRLDRAALSKTQALFHRGGLSLALSHPGMVAERLLPPVRPLPAIDIRPVATAADRVAFCEINAIAFRIPFSWCREIYDIEGLWGGELSGYVGFANGRPVTTVAALVAGGTAGLYGVATLPDSGGHGYAEALIRHALARTREQHGIERTILQACAEALPLYHRLGYRVVTQFSAYSS